MLYLKGGKNLLADANIEKAKCIKNDDNEGRVRSIGISILSSLFLFERDKQLAILATLLI